MPGDILKAEIRKIELRDYGIMRTSTTDGAFCHLYKERTARRFFFSIIRRRDIWDSGLIRSCAECGPQIGVIGTAPAKEGVPAITPGSHGGNMDCRRIRQGSVLYLPVSVPGALLSVGDLHALMGDGETESAAWKQQER